MTHPGEILASVVVFIVAVVATVLAVLAWKAQQRTQSRKLRFVVFAFALFAIKGVVVGISLLTEMVEHEHLEAVSAVFDLAIVGLLIWPILR